MLCCDLLLHTILFMSMLTQVILHQRWVHLHMQVISNAKECAIKHSCNVGVCLYASVSGFGV